MKMKLFFLLFLVVLLWSNNHALRCVNQKNPMFFSASELKEVKEYIDSLDTPEGYKACFIIYGVLYPGNIFVLIFTEDIGELPGNVNTDVFFHVILTMTSNGNIVDAASGQKLFSFRCDDQDTCERQFWHDHIDWFIREESAALEAAFRSILTTENKEKVECTVQGGNNEEPCSSDACLIDDTEQGIMRDCAEEGKRETSVQFTIKISFSTNDNIKDSLTMTKPFISFTYTCQFNHCNNQETENKMRKAVDDHFNLSSMYQVFKTNLQDKQTTKFNTGSISYSTTSIKLGWLTSDPQQTTSTTESSSTSDHQQTTITTQSSSTSDHQQATITTKSSSTSDSQKATIRTQSSSTSDHQQTTSTTPNPSPSISEQKTSEPPNTSILHFISMNILILHILFLMFF